MFSYKSKICKIYLLRASNVGRECPSILLYITMTTKFIINNQEDTHRLIYKSSLFELNSITLPKVKKTNKIQWTNQCRREGKINSNTEIIYWHLVDFFENYLSLHCMNTSWNDAQTNGSSQEKFQKTRVRRHYD